MRAIMGTRRAIIDEHTCIHCRERDGLPAKAGDLPDKDCENIDEDCENSGMGCRCVVVEDEKYHVSIVVERDLKKCRVCHKGNEDFWTFTKLGDGKPIPPCTHGPWTVRRVYIHEKEIEVEEMGLIRLADVIAECDNCGYWAVFPNFYIKHIFADYVEVYDIKLRDAQ
jgi:hypothetical protein